MVIDALMGTFCDVDDVRLLKAAERAGLAAEEAVSKPAPGQEVAATSKPGGASAAGVRRRAGAQ